MGKLKIDIVCEVDDFYSDTHREVFRCRVPENIEVIDYNSVIEMIKIREVRIRELNLYIDKFNAGRDIMHKKMRAIEYVGTEVITWCPVIPRSSLEFVCEKF